MTVDIGCFSEDHGASDDDMAMRSEHEPHHQPAERYSGRCQQRRRLRPY